MTTTARPSAPTQHLTRPQGTIAFQVEGSGPLVVLAPGIGDLRSVYRDVAAPLVAAGYRVALADLRGHGESATTFAEYGIVPTAEDLAALVEHLGGPATIVGASMSAGSAIWLATHRPELVSSLVLLDPHLRGAEAGWLARTQVRLLGLRPFGAPGWAAYYRSLYKGARPAWFAEHVTQIRAGLRGSGRRRALVGTASALLAGPESFRLADIAVPTLVVHGALDPEFADPAAELEFALDAIPGAQGLLATQSGHYPHAQEAAVVVGAVLDHLAKVSPSSNPARA